MLPRNDTDRIQVTFDDHRLVANAGLLLPVTLAQHLGLRELVYNHVDLGAAPGRANTGDKMMTLVASAFHQLKHTVSVAQNRRRSHWQTANHLLGLRLALSCRRRSLYFGSIQ